MIIFGCIQLLFIQIPDMDRLWWLSIVATVMCFVHANTGVGLSISRATRECPVACNVSAPQATTG